MTQLLQPPFDEIESLVKERLRDCALEIYGVQHAWANPPSVKFQREDCPCAYGMTAATVPVQNNSPSHNDLLYGRNFVQRFMIAPFKDGVDDIEMGSEIQQTGDVLISRILLYYHAHPRLHLQNQPPLKYVQYLQSVVDSGIVLRPAAGGKMFAAIDVTITTVLRRNIPKALTIWREDI